MTSSAATPPARRRLAAAITELCSPAVVVVLLSYAVSYAATRGVIPTLTWGTLVAVLSSMVPMGYIVWGARRGSWEGHHVRRRVERLVPLGVLTGCNLVGMVLVLVLGAPGPVVALQGSMLASLVVTTAVTLVWKVSIHVAVAAGALIVMAACYGAWWYLAWLAVAAIAWARVSCRDHTVAQTVAGAALGAVLGGGLFVILV